MLKQTSRITTPAGVGQANGLTKEEGTVGGVDILTVAGKQVCPPGGMMPVWKLNVWAPDVHISSNKRGEMQKNVRRDNFILS